MRVQKFIVAALFLSAALSALDVATAQNAINSVPDAFFGAQRGRVVAHAHGGYRMRYGRGLTAEGAGVITTGITTIGPLLPAIIGAAPAAVYSPEAYFSPSLAVPYNDALMRTAAAAQSGQCNCPEGDGKPPADPVLDVLADRAETEKRLKNLDGMLERLKPILSQVGKDFYQPTVAPPPDQNDASGPVNVAPGVRINPPQAAPQSPAASAARPCNSAAEAVTPQPAG